MPLGVRPGGCHLLTGLGDVTGMSWGCPVTCTQPWERHLLKALGMSPVKSLGDIMSLFKAWRMSIAQRLGDVTCSRLGGCHLLRLWGMSFVKGLRAVHVTALADASCLFKALWMSLLKALVMSLSRWECHLHKVWGCHLLIGGLENVTC